MQIETHHCSLPGTQSRKGGRQNIKTYHPRYCQWQNLHRLYCYKAFLHPPSHLILILVSAAGQKRTEVTCLRSLSCDLMGLNTEISKLLLQELLKTFWIHRGSKDSDSTPRDRHCVGCLTKNSSSAYKSPTLVCSLAPTVSTWLLLAEWQKRC